MASLAVRIAVSARPATTCSSQSSWPVGSALYPICFALMLLLRRGEIFARANEPGKESVRSFSALVFFRLATVSSARLVAPPRNAGVVGWRKTHLTEEPTLYVYPAFSPPVAFEGASSASGSGSGSGGGGGWAVYLRNGRIHTLMYLQYHMHSFLAYFYRRR